MQPLGFLLGSLTGNINISTTLSHDNLASNRVNGINVEWEYVRQIQRMVPKLSTDKAVETFMFLIMLAKRNLRSYMRIVKL